MCVGRPLHSLRSCSSLEASLDDIKSSTISVDCVPFSNLLALRWTPPLAVLLSATPLTAAQITAIETHELFAAETPVVHSARLEELKRRRLPVADFSRIIGDYKDIILKELRRSGPTQTAGSAALRYILKCTRFDSYFMLAMFQQQLKNYKKSDVQAQKELYTHLALTFAQLHQRSPTMLRDNVKALVDSLRLTLRTVSCTNPNPKNRDFSPSKRKANHPPAAAAQNAARRRALDLLNGRLPITAGTAFDTAAEIPGILLGIYTSFSKKQYSGGCGNDSCRCGSDVEVGGRQVSRAPCSFFAPPLFFYCVAPLRCATRPFVHTCVRVCDPWLTHVCAAVPRWGRIRPGRRFGLRLHWVHDLGRGVLHCRQADGH